jgi:hypothetical protein
MTASSIAPTPMTASVTCELVPAPASTAGIANIPVPMMLPITSPVAEVDAFSWRMERDPALRSTIVVVDWLDRAPDWEALVTRVDRLSRLMPALRQRVIESPFVLTAPRWSYAR